MNRKILLAAFMQETATFNPVRTRYEDFQIHRGLDILQAFPSTQTELAGILSILDSTNEVEIVPVYSARAVSGGPVLDADLDRIIAELLTCVEEQGDIDAACIVFHGAMAGESEPDPEGRVLDGIRNRLGDVPIVITLDLHAVITDRLISGSQIQVPYHTYPHTDHFETGVRAARLLLRMLNGKVNPTTARVKIPMLVRGDELLTATGLFGQAIDRCKELESRENGLAAGVIIGNPFTDVPDLRSNILVTTDNDPECARDEAIRLAEFMWHNRAHFFAELTSVDEAIDRVKGSNGLTVFSDAADATASGAPGDSNAILRALVHAEFSGTALLSVVDAPAASLAFSVEVGQQITTNLGGSLDPGRHPPLSCTVTVKSQFDGEFIYEDGTRASAGKTAVLVSDGLHILVTEKPVYVVGRNVYTSHGVDPADFDLVVVKSPNGFRTNYESIAAQIVSVDVPGATSANLHSLPYARCSRPIYPLEENTTYTS
jgi:microcystin degradation protein MlrC